MFHSTGRSGCQVLVVLDQESTAVSSRERRPLTEQNIPHSTFANNILFLATSVIFARMHEKSMRYGSSV